MVQQLPFVHDCWQVHNSAFLLDVQQNVDLITKVKTCDTHKTQTESNTESLTVKPAF